MRNIKKLFTGKFVRGIALFAAAAVILQFAAMVFMSREGLDSIYPYVLAVRSEKIGIGDADLGEYFSLHKDVEDAGLIILAVDTRVDASYSLAADYLQFLGKFTRISYAVTHVPNTRLRSISAAAVDGDHESFVKACDSHRISKALPEELFEFYEKIYSMNSRLAPGEKISISGVKGYDELNDIKNAITSDLLLVPGGLYGEHTEVMEAETPQEYAELFTKHESTLREMLGDRFDLYHDTLDAVLVGDIEEEFTFRNLVKYAPAGEGAVFALLPRSICGEDSVLIKKAEEVYGKVVVTNTVYYDCIAYDKEGNIELDEGTFPNYFSGIRIASAEDLAGFRNYYDRVSNGVGANDNTDSDNAIRQAGKQTFFIISGANAVKYEKETVASTSTS